jgi:hypothetical protein
VLVSELTTLVETGGSTILSYNIQVDDGSSNFIDIQGYSSDSLLLSAAVAVEQGVIYGFRYRAKNIYGWSQFSPTAFILAASPPSAPPKPLFMSATDNSISIKLQPSIYDYGSYVTAYILEIDEGTPNS